MASSEYWRELANLFRLIPSGDSLRADGTYLVGSHAPWNWELRGTASYFVLNSFETLARRGASEIASSGAPDLLIVWLETVKKKCFTYFQSAGTATEVKEDGSDGRHYFTGSINNLCMASATLCKMLENEAVQAEFEEKQRDNPRNWSQFRQRIEAFESMKEVRNEPPYRIPEAVVRSIIAEMDGIKPEDVTWKRIAFEVAGLGGPNRRHIEVVPSTPPPASLPMPEATPEGEGVPANTEKPSEPPPPGSVSSEIERRKKLLAEYKAAAGDPTDYRIYNAANSRIHKPEFYKWKNGTLSAHSTTAVNFERFLSEKKPPIQRDKQ